MKYLFFLFISLMVLSVSCQHSPDQEFKTDRQLSPEFVVVEIAGKQYIDMDQSVCRAGDYEYSLDRIGPGSKVARLPIMECNLMLGFGPQEYRRFTTFTKGVRATIKSHIRSHQKAMDTDQVIPRDDE